MYDNTSHFYSRMCFGVYWGEPEQVPLYVTWRINNTVVCAWMTIWWQHATIVFYGDSCTDKHYKLRYFHASTLYCKNFGFMYIATVIPHLTGTVNHVMMDETVRWLYIFIWHLDTLSYSWWGITWCLPARPRIPSFTMIDVRIVFQLKSTGNVVTNALVEKYIKTVTILKWI